MYGRPQVHHCSNGLLDIEPREFKMAHCSFALFIDEIISFLEQLLCVAFAVSLFSLSPSPLPPYLPYFLAPAMSDIVPHALGIEDS